MIYHAKDLSDYEKCAKLPLIARKWEPERYPVREVVKRYIAEGLFRDPEDTADEFLREAAAVGFEYPEGEPYELAKDYASWLDAAFRVVLETSGSISPIPRFELLGDEYQVDGFLSETGHNVVRVVHELGDRRLRWPELIALGLGSTEITVHQIKLPSVRKRRVQSPLCLAYRQPMTGGMRLAKLDREKISFGPSWKRIGRWEVPEVSWQEWRDGIDRDRCLGSIIETYSVPALRADEKRRLLNDIEHITVSMSKGTHPRKWEACETCNFKRFCHEGRHGFIRKVKVVQRSTMQREDEATVVLSQGQQPEGRQEQALHVLP
jgi:hypothetical protein